jgi:hypothetical protein
MQQVAIADFGRRIKFNVHIHFFCTRGSERVFVPNDGISYPDWERRLERVTMMYSLILSAVVAS